MVLFGCVRAAYINLENYIIFENTGKSAIGNWIANNDDYKNDCLIHVPTTYNAFKKLYEIILPSKSTVPDWSVSISAIISLSCSPVNWSSNAPRISRNDEIGMNPLPETLNYDNCIHYNFPSKEFLFIPTLFVIKPERFF